MQVCFYELEYRFNLDSAYEVAETFAGGIFPFSTQNGKSNEIQCQDTIKRLNTHSETRIEIQKVG